MIIFGSGSGKCLPDSLGHKRWENKGRKDLKDSVVIPYLSKVQF